MAKDITSIQQRISEQFPNETGDFAMINDIFTVTVKPEACKSLIEFLYSDDALQFQFLTDLCGVHYPDNPQDKQFAVVYHLHNWIENIRIRVKTFLSGENPQTESITSIFASANWMERETYDFFGITFTGHPNLKRILNHDGMKAFPLRKEYPLEDQFRTDKDDRFFGREPSSNNY